MRRDRMRMLAGLALLEHRNTWASIPEIAYETGMTPRQVCTFIHQIPGVQVQSEEVSWGRRAFLTADDQEAIRIWNYLMSLRYDSDNLMNDLHERIPFAGWISSRDLTAETGATTDDILSAVPFMGDVVFKIHGKLTYFMRVDDNDVLQYHGTPEPGNCIIE